MEAVKLNSIEKTLLNELLRKNLSSVGVEYGKFTKKGIQIFDKERSKIVGYLNKPSIEETDSLYDFDYLLEEMGEFVAKALKLYGKQLYMEKMFFDEDYDGNMYGCKAEHQRGRLTDFVCGENFFEEGNYLERIDTRGDYEENLLNDFWDEFGEGTYPVCQLSELENVSIAHYKGKYWEIHPTYFSDSVELYGLACSSREELRELLFENFNKLKSESYFEACTMYYRHTAENKVVQNEYKKAKEIINKSAYSLEFNSGVERVWNYLFLGNDDDFSLKDELCSLASKIEKEQELGGLMSCANNLATALTEKLLDTKFEVFSIQGLEPINFIQKAREILSSKEGFSLELENREWDFKGVYFQGVWKLVRDNQDYHLDWRELIFNTEDEIEKAIKQIEEKTKFAKSVEKRKEGLKKAFEDSAKFIVSLNDSFAVGNCEVGTRDFCINHDIDVNKIREISASKLCEIIKQERRSDYKYLAENVLLFAHRKYMQNLAQQ